MRFQNSVVSPCAARSLAKQKPRGLHRARVWVIVMAVACGPVLLAGCGQKGPLSLPTSKTPAGAASAPAR